MMMMMMMNRYGCRFENGRRKSNFDCTMCRRNDDCIYGEISWEERMMYLMYFEASKSWISWLWMKVFLRIIPEVRTKLTKIFKL